MKKYIVNIFCVALVALLGFSCSQNDSSFGSLVKDNRPAIPVLITGSNVFVFAGNPTSEVSVSGPGNIEATVSIPATSGRTIKEIRSIIAGNGVSPGALTSPTTTKLNTAPITVGGTEFKFSTTLAQVRLRYPSATVLNLTPLPLPAPPAPPTYRLVSFMFLVVLDNDQEIVAVPFDVRLRP